MQEPHAILDLSKNALGNDRLAVSELEGIEPATASEIGRSTQSAIVRPFTLTERLCAFSRRPPQAVQGRSERYGSSSACSVPVPASYRTAQVWKNAFELDCAHPATAPTAAARGASRQLAERDREINAEIPTERLQRLAQPACDHRAPRARFAPSPAT